MEDWSAVRMAVENEDEGRLRRLLAEGADVNEVEPTQGSTLLHHAIDIEVDGAAQTGEPLTVNITRVLLEFGADPAIADQSGRTPLQEAEERGHFLAAALIREALRSPE